MKISIVRGNHFYTLRCRRGVIAGFIAFVCALLLVSAAFGAIVSRKISGEMPDFGGVTSYNVSPDGTYTVFRADRVIDGMMDLYSVSTRGGTPILLNPPLVNGGSIQNYQITSDNLRVVYRADQETDEQDELYSVPIGGGAAIKLNSPLVSGGNVVGFQVSPDSTGVVYMADQEVNDELELYHVPINGGTPIKLSEGLPDDYDVASFGITPDGLGAVFRVGTNYLGVIDLYSVIFSVGTLQKLNDSGSVEYFGISPNGQYVVYTAAQTVTTDLYSVPVGGGVTPIQLTPPWSLVGLSRTTSKSRLTAWELYSVSTVRKTRNMSYIAYI